MAARTAEERIALIDAKIAKRRRRSRLWKRKSRRSSIPSPCAPSWKKQKQPASPRKRSRRSWGLRCDPTSDRQGRCQVWHRPFSHSWCLLPVTVLLPFRTVFPYKAGREPPADTAHCRTCRGIRPAEDTESARTPKAPAEGCPYKTAYPHCRR